MTTKPFRSVKDTCVFQLELSRRFFVESIADFTNREIEQGSGPLRSAREILESVGDALDDAVALVPGTGTESISHGAGDAAELVDLTKRRLAALNGALVESTAEHFATKPPSQPNLPMPEPSTVAEAVMAIAMYLAMLTGELQIIRAHLGKREIDWHESLGL